MSRSTKGFATLATLVVAVAWLSPSPSVDIAAADSNTAPKGPTIGPDVEAVEISLAFRPQPDAKRVGYFGFGEPATEDMIAGWDIDVRPDGKGLPPGSGSVEDGEAIYEEQCAACHGFFGEGEGRWPKLAGGQDTLTEDRPEKTVGSYWPYASTLWDYVHRAMPFYQPQSLSDDEVYAVSAYILYLNDIVADDFVLSHENLAGIQMPNRDGFFVDPRPDVKNTACMKGCKDPESINITWDSTELGVTPTEHFRAEEPESAATAVHAIDPNLGLTVYQQACATCHKGGLAGAPIVGQSAPWRARLEQGMAVLVEHAVKGYQGSAGYMPPKGGQIQLTDQEVAAAVHYMVKISLEE